MRTHTISLIGFGLGICLLAGAFIVWQFSTNLKPDTKIQTEKSSATATSTQDQTTSLDTDSDGLKDWEEALWGTDPKNPDTDEDGTPDGEEVAVGRNPMKKGPDDQMTNTPTYIYLQQQGSFISNFSTPSPVVKSETPPISNTIVTKSPLVLYGNSMALAFESQKKRVPNELELFNTTISNPTSESFRALKTVAESYRILADDFSHISGPTETTEITQKLSFGYADLSATVSKMSQQESPSNTELFKLYDEKARSVIQEILVLVNFLNNKKVQFGPDDPGSMFITPQ
jgi:hypothetical protein